MAAHILPRISCYTPVSGRKSIHSWNFPSTEPHEHIVSRMSMWVLQSSGFCLKPWLLVEMCGDPMGREIRVTKVTSTASVPWKRKEARWVPLFSAHDMHGWWPQLHAFDRVCLIFVCSATSKAGGVLRSVTLQIHYHLLFFAANGFAHERETWWLLVLWPAWPNLPHTWWRDPFAARCCLAVLCSSPRIMRLLKICPSLFGYQSARPVGQRK
jgi:hypothetical protein